MQDSRCCSQAQRYLIPPHLSSGLSLLTRPELLAKVLTCEPRSETDKDVFIIHPISHSSRYQLSEEEEAPGVMHVSLSGVSSSSWGRVKSKSHVGFITLRVRKALLRAPARIGPCVSTTASHCKSTPQPCTAVSLTNKSNSN